MRFRRRRAGASRDSSSRFSSRCSGCAATQSGKAGAGPEAVAPAPSHSVLRTSYSLASSRARRPRSSLLNFPHVLAGCPTFEKVARISSQDVRTRKCEQLKKRYLLSRKPGHHIPRSASKFLCLGGCDSSKCPSENASWGLNLRRRAKEYSSKTEPILCRNRDSCGKTGCDTSKSSRSTSDAKSV
jgi:hypothetical protein